MRSIILLHGAIGAKDQLEPLAKELSSLGYKTYLFNFSGHGDTPYANEFGIKQFTLELDQFLSENNLVKPDVFGYSMGGYVALYLASQHPERLGKIITLGTKFNWDLLIAHGEAKMLDTGIIKEKIPKFAAALEKRHGDGWEFLLKKTAAMMIDLGNDNVLNARTFSQIKNKVLIGLADNDSMVTIEETNNAVSKIVDAKRYTLVNTKHPIETVKVAELAKTISEFN